MEDGMKSNIHGLLAAAALSMAGAGVALQPVRQTTQRRDKPHVKRMVTSASDEIKAWNAAVDAKKRSKEPKP